MIPLVFSKGLIVFCARCASCALDVSMRNICARLYFFPQCAIYAQDFRKIVLLSPMRNICARFGQDCSYFPQCAIYICKICTRLYLFPQCAIYAQDLRKIVLILQCAIYAQHLRKIVLISPMCNICERFAQDCSYFFNVQYTRKICARLYLTSNLKW